MAEDRMENRPPTSKKVGKRKPVEVEERPADHDTETLRHTATPDEHDAEFAALGKTHTTEGSDSSDEDNVTAPANFTVMSPSLILGKDVVSLGDFKLLRKLGE